MNDDELKAMVHHLAKLHGVTPEHVVAEAMGEEPPPGAGREGEAFEEDGEADGSDGQAAGGETEPRAKPLAGRGARRTAWLLSMVVMGVLVGAVVVGWLKFVNGPAEANIKPGQAGVPSTSPSASPASGQLVGQTFQFDFPPGFDQVTSQKPDSAFTEEYRVGSKDNYRRLITVSVRNLNPGTLSDDASYKLRQIQSSTYRESAITLAGEHVALMTNVNGQEQTMFWLHAGKLLTIAVTSTDPGDDVTAFMKDITNTLRWKT